MGEVAARRFIVDGAFVTVGDMDVQRGEALEAELNGKLKFVQCNIKSWEDQVALFETAIADGRGIDVVIANAGISRSSGDSLWKLDGRSFQFYHESCESSWLIDFQIPVVLQRSLT